MRLGEQEGNHAGWGVGGRASPEILAETDARVVSPWKGDLRGSRWLCDASASSAYFHTQKPSNPHRSFLT